MVKTETKTKPNNIVLNPKELPSIVGGNVGLDIETTGKNPIKDNILAISISTQNNVYVYDISKYTHDEISSILLYISKHRIIGHNLSFDISFLYHKFGFLPRLVWDTQLASQILSNGTRISHSYYDVVYRYLGIKVNTSSYKELMRQSFLSHKPNEELTPEQLQYSGSDVEYLIPLYIEQSFRVKQDGLDNIARLENRLLPVIVKMQVCGCRIDKTGWLATIDYWKTKRNEVVKRLDEELRSLNEKFGGVPKNWLRERRERTIICDDLFGNQEKITLEADYSCNYSSHEQILSLFKYLNQPVPTVVDGDKIKESSGEDSLRRYVVENPNTSLRTFIELLLKFREYEKLLSVYGESFLDLLDDNNYIHTNYNQCFAQTGRLSSSNPNLQNIPATSLEKDGYDIRRFFLPDPNHLMITCDMDSAEVRIAADYSKEPTLIDALLDNKDLHSDLASISFSIIFQQPVSINKTNEVIVVDNLKFTKRELRDAHKSVLFAKFYKGGAKRCYDILAEYINLFYKKDQMLVASKISSAIDEKLAVLSAYLNKLIKKAAKDGKLRGSKLGRIRYFTGSVYGEAANYPIQNTNAEALKIAMINIDEYLENTGYGRIVMNIHDEVVVSVVEDKAEEVAKVVQKIMSDSLSWFFDIIPGKATYKIEKYWCK